MNPTTGRALRDGNPSKALSQRVTELPQLVLGEWFEHQRERVSRKLAKQPRENGRVDPRVLLHRKRKVRLGRMPGSIDASAGGHASSGTPSSHAHIARDRPRNRTSVGHAARTSVGVTKSHTSRLFASRRSAPIQYARSSADPVDRQRLRSPTVMSVHHKKYGRLAGSSSEGSVGPRRGAGDMPRSLRDRSASIAPILRERRNVTARAQLVEPSPVLGARLRAP